VPITGLAEFATAELRVVPLAAAIPDDFRGINDLQLVPVRLGGQ
jgi:hypothetical protein